MQAVWHEWIMTSRLLFINLVLKLEITGQIAHPHGSKVNRVDHFILHYDVPIPKFRVADDSRATPPALRRNQPGPLVPSSAHFVFPNEPTSVTKNRMLARTPLYPSFTFSRDSLLI